MDDSAQLSVAKPLFLTQEDVALVAGLSIGRIEDLRSKTLNKKGYFGPAFSKRQFLVGSQYRSRVVYAPEDVREWLTKARPEFLHNFEAFLAKKLGA